jgi:hypothetical protein
MIGIRGYHLEFLIDNASDADLFHQPGYPGSGHIQTTVPWLHGELRTSQTGFGMMMQFQDGCSQYIVFQGSFRRFSVQPRIKCASEYLEDPAHLLNSKFALKVFHKPEYLLSLLKKMLTAFLGYLFQPAPT